MIGRALYLLVVLVGVVVNADEYRRARWVSNALIEKRINGIRQIVARHFTCSAGLLLAIQALLIVPALASFVIPPRDFQSLGEWAVSLAFLALIAHIAMVVLLTRLAFLNRNHREQLVSATEADVPVP